MNNYRQINFEVMTDTVQKCHNIPELQEAIRYSIDHQMMVKHGYDVEYYNAKSHNTQFIISGKRTFEAAKAYKGKKVAVLNFANNHSIGGAPFSADAQEESLCRCSTLFPCLQAMKERFYDRHIQEYINGEINYMGNDDLIYTSDVVVFKTDELTDPIYPKMMPKEDWYKVDVITCAAPELWHGNRMPSDYEEQITSRIKQILDATAVSGVEVLILGAWGCGAFKNPADIVARVFRTQLKNYSFDVVEYALSHTGDLSSNGFARALLNISNSSVNESKSEYNRKYTDEHIERLLPNQVFVFGSNINGLHGGGAARYANKRFGAEWGVGQGMTGQCYAIPTMKGGTSYIGEKIEKFISYAAGHPEKEFLVTKIACGIAGFSVEEIGPLFADAICVRNIILPKEFVEAIEKSYE